MKRYTSVRWFVCALIVGLDGADAFGQSAADLFDRDTVHEVRLYLNARDLGALREAPLDNTYYPADLHWTDQRVRNVGVRSRGNGSRNGTKLGLRVDFNRYVSAQQFLGLPSIILDNLVQDPSMIRERAAMAVMTRMGQPAPRNVFARLYINDEYEGLYAMVEEPGAAYVARTFGETAGYLFEYHWLRRYSFEDLGDDLSAYTPLFEPRTHEKAPASVLYAPIREMVRVGDDADLAAWRVRIERYVDLAQLVTMAAIEAFVSETDGVTGVDGANNFYLYRSATSDRHIFLPWDRDQAFHSMDSSVFPPVENELLRRALAFADLQQLYTIRLEECARMAANDNWLEREIRQAADQVAIPASEDIRKPFNQDELEAELASLVEFARRRSADVLAELSQRSTVLRQRR